jgi:hypothetical protein
MRSANGGVPLAPPLKRPPANAPPTPTLPKPTGTVRTALGKRPLARALADVDRWLTKGTGAGWGDLVKGGPQPGGSMTGGTGPGQARQLARPPHRLMRDPAGPRRARARRGPRPPPPPPTRPLVPATPPPGVWIAQAQADFTQPGAKEYYSALIDRVRALGGLVAFGSGKDVADCGMAAKMDFINGRRCGVSEVGQGGFGLWFRLLEAASKPQGQASVSPLTPPPTSLHDCPRPAPSL